MAKLNARNLASPIAAAVMAVVLGTYIYSSIGLAKGNARIERQRMFEEATEQRRNLGFEIDARTAKQAKARLEGVEKG